MSLKEYQEKRDFEKTPEPKATKSKENKKRIFVVQKHDARNLHFDFRLEADGVLKSWAVPKGPSMNHNDKRLAIMVEDHPLDYASFQGEIPEGEYGAGTVEIWDSGTWEPDEHHQDIEAALRKGSLDFFLHGKKLQGEFILIKTNYEDAKNSWMLQKKEDKDAIDKKYDAKKISSK
ncbi:MAG: DNA polymerase ligase N-terminal domain-containing protein [Dysgonomonas sp.]|nr:DNA polymerase ligase N-terminal domain-containing protein [Dysgonomonas sp.]